MYYYQYLIAGMRVLCRIPFPVVIQEEAENFLFPVKNDGYISGRYEDAIVTLAPTGSLPEIPESAVARADRYYSVSEKSESWIKRYQVHYCPCPGKPPYACALWDSGENDRLVITCLYLPGNEFRFSHSRMISDHIGMETFFIWKSCLMLHASFIRHQEKGILFTAPSGTGKSTQAELWKMYEDAEILNGDRAAVRKSGGHWYAYGLPYAGSSGIYRNESARLSAVVVLRQAKENRIRRMKLLEIIQNLYPETTIHHWESDFVEKALTILTELAKEVPFYLLECRPDREAVQLLKEMLSRNDTRKPMKRETSLK